MICPPCSRGEHKSCIEVRRRSALPPLTDTELAGSAWCDCSHKDRAEPGECPVTAEVGFAILRCALLPGHDCEWHWDEHGIDWRPAEATPVVLGAPDSPELAAYQEASNELHYAEQARAEQAVQRRTDALAEQYMDIIDRAVRGGILPG